jgi:hypothetical protein
MHGPTCIFWANLTPLSPQTWNEAARQAPTPRCVCLARWNDTDIGGACAREQVGGALSLSDYASVLLFIWRFVWGVV